MWAHGEEHAIKVALTGLELADALAIYGGRRSLQLTSEQRLVLVLFGLLHDSQLDEHWSPGHGPLAAEYARTLSLDSRLGLDRHHLGSLYRALERHEDGEVAPWNPTIGLCWDADRLQLWRLARVPDPELLSISSLLPRSICERMSERARDLASVSCPATWADVLGRLGFKSATTSKATRTVTLYKSLGEEGLDPSEGGTCWTPSADMALRIAVQYDYHAGTVVRTDVEYRPSEVLDLTATFWETLCAAMSTTRERCEAWLATRPLPGDRSALMLVYWRDFLRRGYRWIAFADTVFWPTFGRRNLRALQYFPVATPTWVKLHEEPLVVDPWQRLRDVRDLCPDHVGWPLAEREGRPWCQRGRHHPTRTARYRAVLMRNPRREAAWTAPSPFGSEADVGMSTRTHAAGSR